MKTRGSLRPSGGAGSSCDSDCIPPLTPLAYIVIIFVPFISQIFGNAVTYRQREYAKYFEETYGKAMEPLPDTSILQNIEMPTFASRLAMRDWVNVLCVLWCVLMIFFWLIRRNYVVFSTFLMTEVLLVPVFAISQWLTIIPDSDGECLSSLGELPEGRDWIWFRFSLVQCGDMMWSSSIVQTIIFAMLGFSGIKSRCLQIVSGIFSTCYILCISVLAWAALYQYSCDIILSVFVTLFVSTHPFVRKAGMLIFYRNWSMEPVLFEENMGLMEEEYDEEFGITTGSDND